MNKVIKITGHLKKYLLWYSLVAIAVGWIAGLTFPHFVKNNKKAFGTIITVFVFLMIYPMMINLNLGTIPKFFKKPKPILMTILYNFIITPLISLLFIKIFIHQPELALGFMLVMLIPGSSMSLGYTGITEGSLEVATIGMAVLFILIPIIMPFYVSLLGKMYHVTVPLKLMLKTVLIVLVIPMIAGDLTRRGIIKAKGEEGFVKAKPLFSLITLSTLLFMVIAIFMLKAQVLTQKWQLVINLGIITLIFLVVMFPLITLLNKWTGLSYKEHMAVAFLSTGKNNGTAIAIAMLAFGPLVAIPAAILPLFQIIFSIGYVYLAGRVMKFYGVKQLEDINLIKDKE